MRAFDGQLATVDEVIVDVEPAPPFVVKVFQDGVDGYQGTRDTKIRSDQPNTIFGSNAKLEIDGNPDFSSLIQWDLSAIPAGATILSASITVTAVNTSNDAFELYEVKRPWVEAEATFNQAAAGVAWGTAGASGASDRGTTVLGAVTAPSLGQATVTLNAQGLAVLQRWIANPAANYGLIFQDYANISTDDLDFHSSESSTVSARPRLTIAYTSDPQQNQPPVVQAGPDQTILTASVAALDATVTDDGLPSTGTLTTTWSLKSGPAGGAATFGDARAVDTTVSFDTVGQYVLQLSASDGELTASDLVTITVEETPSSLTQSFRDGVDGYQGTRDTRIRSDQPDQRVRLHVQAGDRRESRFSLP